jgi:hypothetical protein
MQTSSTARGKRVRLLALAPAEMVNTDLVPGDEGEIMFTDSLGTVHVKWGGGGRLGLIPEQDQWEVLDGEAQS